MAWLIDNGQVLSSLEVVDSALVGAKGLLGRRDCNGAVLFRHMMGAHSIGVRFGIDVAFLDARLVVIDVVTLRPNRVAAPRPRARAVLQAEAGAFERWGLGVGDELEVKLEHIG